VTAYVEWVLGHPAARAFVRREVDTETGALLHATLECGVCDTLLSDLSGKQTF